VGKLRDPLLVLTSIDYAVGYAVWSNLAYKLGIGAPAVLDAQYFIAGAPILIVLVVVVLGLLSSAPLGERWRTFLSSKSRRTQHVVAISLIVATVLSLTVTVVLTWQLPERICELYQSCSMQPELAALAALVVSTILTFLLGYSRIGRSTRDHRVERVYLAFMILGLGFLAIIVFVAIVYPRLPQAIGGAKPRCAILDIRAAEVSNSTLIELGSETAETPESVVKSGRLNVYYATQQSLAVSLNVIGEEGARGDIVVELPRAAVKATIWCDRWSETPGP
jgi:hypothetical protein